MPLASITNDQVNALLLDFNEVSDADFARLIPGAEHMYKAVQEAQRVAAELSEDQVEDLRDTKDISKLQLRRILRVGTGGTSLVGRGLVALVDVLGDAAPRRMPAGRLVLALRDRNQPIE